MTESRRAVRAGAPASRVLLAATTALLLAAGLSGCSDESWAAQEGTNEGGYIAGDGSWRIIDTAERAEPVLYQGVDEYGENVDSAELLGEVTVLNFWYASCPPCRAEAADLETVWQEYEDDGVKFLGVNIYDQAATVHSFNDSFGITYPSILDVDTAQVRLAFADNVSPQTIPTTLVIDRQGRVASYIRGPIEPSTLRGMIDDLIAEPAA